LTETVSEITERVYRELEEALRSLEAKGVIMVDDQQITKESTTL
jgi:predicted transcriptional regulator